MVRVVRGKVGREKGRRWGGGGKKGKKEREKKC